MIADISFQPPVGLVPVVRFQPPVAVAPALELTRSGQFQAELGLSTPLIEYNRKRRESLSLLNNSSESLDALRLRMSETFRATTSETWRPSR